MKKWIPVLVVIVCTLLSACASSDPAVRETGPDRVIGWLHGNCLALDDVSIPAGAQVVVVTLGEPEKVVVVNVTGRALGAESCPPLLDDRKDVNLDSGLAFYQVDADPVVELGIGVVQPGGDRELSVTELLDINGDGRRDSFSHCNTSEGMQFSVWADKAGRRTPLWTGYYYLGYDIEANCPEGG